MFSEEKKAEKELIESWYTRAKDVQPGEVDKFIAELMGHPHDYNTVVEAVAASAVAAAWAANRHDNGGITGFQAGFVMWRFVQKWLHLEGPLKLVKFEDMLYPQYQRKFERTIDPETWEYLQKEAKKLLESERGVPEVRAHWQSIADGQLPFGYTVTEED